MSFLATITNPKQFIVEATKNISDAKTRVYVMTMVMQDDGSTSALFDQVAEAARRGLDVRVAGDLFTYSELGGHFKLIIPMLSSSLRDVRLLRRNLVKAGVRFQWLGTRAISLITSRTHTKWLIVDDHVYCFGGVNLYGTGIKNTDYMFSIEHKQLADRLVKEHQHIISDDRAGRASRSYNFDVDEKNTVLIDGGYVGRSIIYKRACQLAEQCTTATFVSQYCPTGKIGKILKRKNAKFYFNKIENTVSLNLIATLVGSFFSRIKNSYRRKRYLHAKCVVFQMPDGSKHAITGSHNLTSGGVWLGTREVALETTDTAVIAQIESFIVTNVA